MFLPKTTSSQSNMARFGPLEINPSTKEPFLRLRKHPSIIVTPPRPTDVPLIVPPLNDERVHVWLKGPPYPYTEEHARQFIDLIKSNCDQGIQELLEAETEENAPLILSHFPVRYLREVQEDGSDIFLGDIGIDRCADVEGLIENPKVDNAANLSLPSGHPDIVWTIGYFLVPSYHGQGIMSDACDTLINDLGRPHLGVRNIVTTTFLENEASMKVFLKNDFKLTRQIADRMWVKGKLRSFNVFECHFAN